MPTISPARILKIDTAKGAGDAKRGIDGGSRSARQLLAALLVIFGLQAAADHDLVQFRRGTSAVLCSATTSPSFIV